MLSLEDALPYITNTVEIRGIVEILLKEADSMNSIIKHLEKKMMNEKDLEIKTDIKILINSLKKRIEGEAYGT